VILDDNNDCIEKIFWSSVKNDGTSKKIIFMNEKVLLKKKDI
jgi:hypothetical protein